MKIALDNMSSRADVCDRSVVEQYANFDFPFQLSTIYETKPPISKAKVASVTRLAVKAIKVCAVFYLSLLFEKMAF